MVGIRPRRTGQRGTRNGLGDFGERGAAGFQRRGGPAERRAVRSRRGQVDGIYRTVSRQCPAGSRSLLSRHLPASRQEVRDRNQHFSDTSQQISFLRQRRRGSVQPGHGPLSDGPGIEETRGLHGSRRSPGRDGRQVSPGEKYRICSLLPGRILPGAGDPRQALDAYKKVLGKSPGNTLAADTFYALGTTQQEQGQDSDAIATFQKFLKPSGPGPP